MAFSSNPNSLNAVSLSICACTSASANVTAFFSLMASSSDSLSIKDARLSNSSVNNAVRLTTCSFSIPAVSLLSSCIAIN